MNFFKATIKRKKKLKKLYVKSRKENFYLLNYSTFLGTWKVRSINIFFLVLYTLVKYISNYFSNHNFSIKRTATSPFPRHVPIDLPLNSPKKTQIEKLFFLYSKRFIIFFICLKFFLGIIKNFWEYIIRDFLLMLCRYIYLRIVGSAFCNNTMHYTIIIWLSHIHIHIQVCMLNDWVCIKNVSKLLAYCTI